LTFNPEVDQKNQPKTLKALAICKVYFSFTTSQGLGPNVALKLASPSCLPTKRHAEHG